MSPNYLLVLLSFNVAIVFSFSADYDTNTYDDRNDDARYNLLELYKNLAVKGRENRREATEPPYLENWTGRWFPERSGNPTPPPKVWPSTKPDPSHRLPMGKINNCDDGKTNLEIDWDKSDTDYICYDDVIKPQIKIRPLIYTEAVPSAYTAAHKCMNETIEYDDDIPLYGSHRPVYPVYGEYSFIPKQRWIHSLEHGAVVMLYDRCADPNEVKLLKKLVKNCLRRHIVTPYDRLDKKRPLALVTWGSRLTMSFVTPKIAINFMKDRSLRGPEEIASDGDFSDGLLFKSNTVTDFNDSIICPNM